MPLTLTLTMVLALTSSNGSCSTSSSDLKKRPASDSTSTSSSGSTYKIRTDFGHWTRASIFNHVQFLSLARNRFKIPLKFFAKSPCQNIKFGLWRLNHAFGSLGIEFLTTSADTDLSFQPVKSWMNCRTAFFLSLSVTRMKNFCVKVKHLTKVFSPKI